jgi:hypothetical protein
MHRRQEFTKSSATPDSVWACAPKPWQAFERATVVDAKADVVDAKVDAVIARADVVIARADVVIARADAVIAKVVLRVSPETWTAAACCRFLPRSLLRGVTGWKM